MTENFIKLDKSKIEEASKIIAKEFELSPVVSYIFPEKEVREKILPLMFENLLTIYDEIGITYTNSNKIDFTFSLIAPSKLFNTMSSFSALLKTIPNSIEALFSMHIIEASKRLMDIEASLKKAFSYISNNDDYIFLSSIAAKEKSSEDMYLNNMIDFCIKESNKKGMKLLVETETQNMVELYKSHGFKLGTECNLEDNNIYIYILEYEPSIVSQ